MKARQWALQHVVNKDLIASPPRFRGLGTWEGRLQLSASRPTGVGMAQVPSSEACDPAFSGV